jgi:DNA-binding CsgD family transcriptional regulator
MNVKPNSPTHLAGWEECIGQVFRPPAQKRKRKPLLPGPSIEDLIAPEDWPTLATEFALSNQEWKIVALLLQRKTRKQIARKLQITMATLKTYLGRVFRKMAVANQKEVLFRIVEFISRKPH